MCYFRDLPSIYLHYGRIYIEDKLKYTRLTVNTNKKKPLSSLPYPQAVKVFSSLFSSGHRRWRAWSPEAASSPLHFCNLLWFAIFPCHCRFARFCGWCSGSVFLDLLRGSLDPWLGASVLEFRHGGEGSWAAGVGF